MVLVLALIAVFAVINGVRPAHLEKFFTTFAGNLEASGTARPAGRFNLCKTRVHAIIWPDGKKIEEFREGMTMKWMAHDPQPREIGYIEMEKWLGEHCSFATAAGPEAPSTTGEEVIKVEFIDKTVLKIGLGPDNLFRIENEVFRSPEFSHALRELRTLGQFEEKH